MLNLGQYNCHDGVRRAFKPLICNKIRKRWRLRNWGLEPADPHHRTNQCTKRLICVQRTGPLELPELGGEHLGRNVSSMVNCVPDPLPLHLHLVNSRSISLDYHFNENNRAKEINLILIKNEVENRPSDSIILAVPYIKADLLARRSSVITNHDGVLGLTTRCTTIAR